MLSSQQELERFLDKSSALFTKGIRDIFRARYGRSVDENSPIKAMADLIGNTMKLADLNGRKRILMEADHIASKAKFAIEKTPLSPLPFVEAIEDLISREPRLAAGYQAVSRLYNTEHVFALAKSVNQNLTNRIQKAIGDSVERGEGLPEFDKLWREITPWSQAYGDVVYRTNASTAYTNGRFAQAEDEDVKEVIPAMVFYSMHLPDSRPNHAAADGLIAATDDPIWKTFKPPLGYNCACGTNFVSKYELERRGLISNGQVVRYLPPTFASAHPDEGFRPGGWEF